VDSFPTYFVDLTQLPIAPEALPLLMVAKGPQERQLVEFLVDHSQQYPMHVQLLRELHVHNLRDVLRMRQLTPEQIGIDYQALLDLLGEERAVKLIGEERLLEMMGEDHVRAWLEKRVQEKQDQRKGSKPRPTGRGRKR
jgi:hypothetical protein